MVHPSPACSMVRGPRSFAAILFGSLVFIPIATAAGFEVGVGTRGACSAIDDAGTWEGPRILGRWVNPTRTLAWEIDMFYRTNQESHTGLVATLVNIAEMGSSSEGFQQPFNADTFTVSALADWSPVPRDRSAALSGGPHLVGGLGLANYTSYYGTYNEDYPSAADDPVLVSLNESKTDVRVTTGFTLDAWVHGRMGLRVSWLAQWAAEDRPQYNSEGASSGGLYLDSNGIFAVDLLIGWGGAQ